MSACDPITAAPAKGARSRREPNIGFGVRLALKVEWMQQGSRVQSEQRVIIYNDKEGAFGLREMHRLHFHVGPIRI